MEDSDIQSKPVTDKKTEFSTLPNEILVKIFCHLEIHDVMNLNLVCKRWHSLSDSDAFWGKFVPRYPGVDLPKAKTQKGVFQKLWSDSVQIGKERWFPNPLSDLVEYNTLLQKHNEENIPGQIGQPFTLSKCMLYLRLNPLYPFTTDGIKHEDPLMQEIVHKISDKRGNISRPGYESDEEVEVGVHDAASLMDMNFFGNRKFAMMLIIRCCYDFQTSEEVAVSMDKQLFDEEGRILEKNVNDHEQVGDAFRVKGGKSLSKRLFNQIRNIVVDKNDRFMIFNVNNSYRNENEGLPYGRQILVSDTAAVYCARRAYWVRNLVN